MGSLFSTGWSSDELDAFLFTFSDVLVHLFCVASQARETIDITILLPTLLVILVAERLCLCCIFEKNSYFIPVNDFNFDLWQLNIGPFLVFEIAKTFANTGAGQIVSFRFGRLDGL